MEDDTRHGAGEKRRYYRVKYPPTERAKLKTGEYEFEVMDISEKGLRFLNDKGQKFTEWVRGTVIFHDGEMLDIEGRIVWRRDDEISLRLITPVPYVRILGEQRRIIRCS